MCDGQQSRRPEEKTEEKGKKEINYEEYNWMIIKGVEEKRWKRDEQKSRLHDENREGKNRLKSWGIAREVEWKDWKKGGKKEVKKRWIEK